YDDLVPVGRRCIAFFFFSSRRRHTRSYGDWSSDVCSSDLSAAVDRVALRLRTSVLGLKRHRRVLDGHCSFGAVKRQKTTGIIVRSEERRVGKEGRCRWAGER